jgi:hypothetical protein
MKGKALMFLVGMTLTGLAIAAQPMSLAEKKAAAKAVADNHKKFNVAPPRTMAEAKATLRQTGSGGFGAAVPTELWSTMHVVTAADGSVRVVETEGNQASAAKAEELPNE